jgi:hypothetical protein
MYPFELLSAHLHKYSKTTINLNEDNCALDQEPNLGPPKYSSLVLTT